MQWSELGGKRPLRLNLGAGKDKRAGWIGIDAKPEHAPDLLYDLTVTPWPIMPQSVDAIYAEMFLSQLDLRGGESVLRESAKALVPGGVMRIHEVDFQVLYAQWMQGEAVRQFADQTFAEKFYSWFRRYGWRMLWDRETVIVRMIQAGFLGPHIVVRGQSEIPELRGLEKRDSGFVIEARTPECQTPNPTSSTV